MILQRRCWLCAWRALALRQCILCIPCT
uniref:Uncharacterized protein n=1 Tax=Arundo donax TaxID=35708 RepID=A0A0A9HKV2_ARUDO